MIQNKIIFDEELVLKKLHHYLPAQAPLKDFVHHNTLHAFQEFKFFKALQLANESLGLKTGLTLKEFREKYVNLIISEEILDKVIEQKKGVENLGLWKDRMLHEDIENPIKVPRIGGFRKIWKSNFGFDLDMYVQPKLFKLVGGFLDQGVAEKRFPFSDLPFLEAIKKMERTSIFSLFRSKRVRGLLFDENTSISSLLTVIVGDKSHFEQYLFDQQFCHTGWSGMISVVENNPQTLLDNRKISLKEFIIFELLLELDAIEKNLGLDVLPISKKVLFKSYSDIFFIPQENLYWECLELWQEAFELQYHDQVLGAIKHVPKKESKSHSTFQAFFCIDDREESIRRHIEMIAPNGETLGTPGHFGMVAVYKPDGGQFVTQIAPGNAKASHVIKEVDRKSTKAVDYHFHHRSHRLISGWFLSQTLGFWSSIKLFVNLFKPSITPAHSSSFEHMEKDADLVIENIDNRHDHQYKVGFSISEMSDVVYNLLNSTGKTDNFAPIVYLIGHGGSSTNNPYYAGYNCGACSGRAGSVNARAVASMANRKDVRERLLERGLNIPKETFFLGGLHDTTRDEFRFYDEDSMSPEHLEIHKQNVVLFDRALDNNAKERARQFLLTNLKRSSDEVHKDVKDRSTALFEPRPELNHSNNTLCIVGRRYLTENIFLDQRAFLNSYDYSKDPSGKYLAGILGAATPVCGGINLEYYFSRVDNEKLGAGSKLPHNVIGLFGVSNGIKGDLRPGLPLQMIDVHDPLRLLMIVEHKPEVVLEVLRRDFSVLEWYQNEWMKLAVIDPFSNNVYMFNGEDFLLYEPLHRSFKKEKDLEKVFENNISNLPVYAI